MPSPDDDCTTNMTVQPLPLSLSLCPACDVHTNLYQYFEHEVSAFHEQLGASSGFVAILLVDSISVQRSIDLESTERRTGNIGLWTCFLSTHIPVLPPVPGLFFLHRHAPRPSLPFMRSASSPLNHALPFTFDFSGLATAFSSPARRRCSERTVDHSTTTRFTYPSHSDDGLLYSYFTHT